MSNFKSSPKPVTPKRSQPHYTEAMRRLGSKMSATEALLCWILSVPRTEGLWLFTSISDEKNALPEFSYPAISCLKTNVHFVESQEKQSPVIRQSLYEGPAHHCRDPDPAVPIGKPHSAGSENVFWTERWTCMLLYIPSKEQPGKGESQVSVGNQAKLPSSIGHPGRVEKVCTPIQKLVGCQGQKIHTSSVLAWEKHRPWMLPHRERRKRWSHL